jgi:serine/threonine kinase 32
MDAIRKLLTADITQRIGATDFSTFTNHPFFLEIDFDALQRKEIAPIFVPSSDKTNFDATYDLEELLLEEAPLEARARRQKPRERLKDDATAQEIREEELHKMIETLFEPFDYTTVAYDKLVSSPIFPSPLLNLWAIR